MSKMKFAFAAVAAFGLLAGAAYARSTVTATIAAPVAQQTEIVASSASAGASVWSCTGDTCVAQLAGEPTARVCRALARKVGTVVTFANLSAEELARCNSGVAAATTSTAVAQR